MNTRRTPFVERLARYVTVTDFFSCWLWRGYKNQHGYGRIKETPQKWVLAHRAMYELFVGPITPGLEVDHECEVRACVNPAHLRVVTPTVNKWWRYNERDTFVIGCDVSGEEFDSTALFG